MKLIEPSPVVGASELQLRAAALDWFALEVSVDRERAATDLLASRGFVVWCPMRKETRRVRYSRRATFERPRALIPGYVLVGCSPARSLDWRALFALKGIYGVVGFGGVPARISYSQIERAFMAISAEAEKEALAAAEAARPPEERFEVGQVVRVDKGPFAGAVVSVAGYRRTGEAVTARVIMEIFGSAREIDSDVDNLKVI